MKKKRSNKNRGARLGQHFLTGLWAAKRLAQSVGVREGETILEIGPGKGALTRELLSMGTRVVAIEKDEMLAAQLRETFQEEITAGNFVLVESDVREFDPKQFGLERYVVAANIPYYITGEIIRQFLTAQVQPRAMALLVQKEVAERIVARDAKESILSISVKAYGEPRIVAKVAKGNFNPPPSVDSAILLIEAISRNFFDGLNEEHFFDVVRTGFSSKRKKLAGNLKKKFETVSLSDQNIRAEDMSLTQWRELALELSGHR